MDNRFNAQGVGTHWTRSRAHRRTEVSRRLILAMLTVGLTTLSIVASPAAGAGASTSTPYIFAPPNQTVGEASGTVTLPVTLNEASSNTVTVAYNVPGGGCNYAATGTSGTLTFAPGTVSQNVTVTINECSYNAKNTFTLTLSTATNATIAQATTQVDVVGDGNLQATPGITVKNTAVDTSAGSVQVPVLLGAANGYGATSSSTVTVNYTTTNGTAVSGTDYTATSGTLTFAPGQTEQNVTVPITDRTGTAGSRNFSVTLSGATNAAIIQGTAVVTIGASGGTLVSSPYIFAPPDQTVGEGDGWIDMPVTLTAPSSNLVTVAYSVTGSGCNYAAAGTSARSTSCPVSSCGPSGSRSTSAATTPRTPSHSPCRQPPTPPSPRPPPRWTSWVTATSRPRPASR